jgi:prepilin-type N-terminal cleavage/methylation domain-containing protein
MKSHRTRRAFSLVEIIVSVTAVAIVAAVAVPRVSGHMNQKRIDQTVTMLGDVRAGLQGAGTGFFHNVGAHAGQLSELTTQIWNGRSGVPPFPRNSCGAPFTSEQVSRWDNAGPYVNFYIPTSGLVTPIGIAEDTLHRAPSMGGPGTLAIVIRGVSRADAEMLDKASDGGTGDTAGAIQWTATAADRVTLRYAMPIDDAC